MDFFYTEKSNITENNLILQGEEHKHLSRILRKEIGETIYVTDGNDTMYVCTIRSITKTETDCVIVRTLHRYNESERDVTIAVSLLKNPSRMDYLVEKTTEIGVRSIIPMICERTIPKREKHSRLEHIALSAIKVCGRSFLPRTQPLTTFQAITQTSKNYQLCIVPHERYDTNQTLQLVMKANSTAKSVLLLIGPEGGFTDEEFSLAVNSGFIPASLGPRRLRAETAAVVALSMVV